MKITVCLCVVHAMCSQIIFESRIIFEQYYFLRQFTDRFFSPYVIAYLYLYIYFRASWATGDVKWKKNIPSFIYDLIQPILDWKYTKCSMSSFPARKSCAVYNLIWVSIRSSLTPNYLLVVVCIFIVTGMKTWYISNYFTVLRGILLCVFFLSLPFLFYVFFSANVMQVFRF